MLCLCYYFSLEAVLQGVAKLTLTKTNRCRNTGDIEAWASVKTQSLSLQIAKTDLNQKLKLLASKYQQQSPGGVCYQHVYVYCEAFILAISFLISLLSILNRFDLSYFFCYQF